MFKPGRSLHGAPLRTPPRRPSSASNINYTKASRHTRSQDPAGQRQLTKRRHRFSTVSCLTASSTNSLERGGGSMSADGVRKMITRTGVEAEIPFPVHPHMLRHATGFKLANDGHDMDLPRFGGRVVESIYSGVRMVLLCFTLGFSAPVFCITGTRSPVCRASGRSFSV